jgi:outer membrane protein TolC
MKQMMVTIWWIILSSFTFTMRLETLQIALQRFTTGTISSLELRESQRALINTETRLIGAFYEAKLSETELLRLAGRLMN